MGADQPFAKQPVETPFPELIPVTIQVIGPHILNKNPDYHLRAMPLGTSGGQGFTGSGQQYEAQEQGDRPVQPDEKFTARVHTFRPLALTGGLPTRMLFHGTELAACAIRLQK